MRIEAHLAICSHCREQIQELTAARTKFRHLLRTVADEVAPSPQAWLELSQRLEIRTNPLKTILQKLRSRLTTGLPILKRKPVIIIAMAALAVISSSMIYLLSSQPTGLALEVNSPANNATLSSNLAKVTGKVSDLRATVEVNGVEALVDHEGSFVAIVELQESSNTIETVATLDMSKATQIVTVEFMPPLAIFLDKLTPEQGVDYSITPIAVTGWVSDAKAMVTLNDIATEVAEDGNFSAQVLLQLNEETGGVVADAVLGGSEDRMDRTISIPPQNGEVFPPTPVPSIVVPPAPTPTTPPAPSPIRLPPPHVTQPPDPIHSEGTILIKAGETTSLELVLNVGKTIREPTPVSYQISYVARLGSTDKLPMPLGLNVSIQPSVFMLYLNTTYKPIIVVRTSPDLPSGDYWLLIERSYADRTSSDWIRLIVER